MVTTPSSPWDSRFGAGVWLQGIVPVPGGRYWGCPEDDRALRRRLAPGPLAGLPPPEAAVRSRPRHLIDFIREVQGGKTDEGGPGPIEGTTMGPSPRTSGSTHEATSPGTPGAGVLRRGLAP